MALVLLLHGRESVVGAYEAAYPGAEVTFVRLEGSAGAYDALAKDTPLLELADELAPGWTPPLVVVAFSAGGWALRRYLADESNREVIRAAAFLDASYGAPGGECDLTPYEGVIEYAKLAAAAPSKAILAMTSSAANPEPYSCSKAIEALAPGGVMVLHETSSHDYQLTDVGPHVVHDIGRLISVANRVKWFVGGAVVLGGFLLWHVTFRHARAHR